MAEEMITAPDARALVKHEGTSLATTMQTAEVFVKSGFFSDSVKLSQAAVKIMAGQELGFGPFASMNGVYIVKGRTSLSANLMATAIKRGGKYNYRIKELTDKIAHLEFFENGEPVGPSVFTIEDARKAGTQNLEKYARNMLFARALSNGAKWYCPDAFSGNPVYSPEEFGLQPRHDGTYEEPVEAEVIPMPASRTEAAKNLLKKKAPAVEPPVVVEAEVVEEPAEVETPQETPAEPRVVGILNMLRVHCMGSSAKANVALSEATGGRLRDIKKLNEDTPDAALDMIESWLKAQQ